MRVTFKASPELLKVCEIGESIGDADDSFRRQFSILVLVAVRNREIPARNKNGFKIPPESLDITERQARDFAERPFLERLGDFDADRQRARGSAAAQPWLQQHYDIDAKLQAYANEYEKYKQHIEPQIQSETNRLLDDWYRDASVLVSEVAEWFCKAHDFEGHMAAPSSPTDAQARSVSDATPDQDAPGEVPEQPDAAPSEAPEKAAPVVTPAADFWADDGETGERLPDDEQGEAATLEWEQNADADALLAELFDPVRVAALETMFPDGGKWAGFAERAKRNGLSAARAGRSLFNPYRAAVWWISQGPHGWKWDRCLRVLANNLPARSRDSRHLLTGEFD